MFICDLSIKTNLTKLFSAVFTTEPSSTQSSTLSFEVFPRVRISTSPLRSFTTATFFCAQAVVVSAIRIRNKKTFFIKRSFQERPLTQKYYTPPLSGLNEPKKGKPVPGNWPECHSQDF